MTCKGYHANSAFFHLSLFSHSLLAWLIHHTADILLLMLEVGSLDSHYPQSPFTTHFLVVLLQYIE